MESPLNRGKGGIEQGILNKGVSRKQAGIAILPSDKTDFKPTLVKMDKAGHFLVLKSISHQKILEA